MTANYNLYHDIDVRTGGEIYLGIVGPVRTGKSTFIKRFMNLLVLPKIEDEPSRDRTRDELPQSATGKTIMTTEPKFIPKEAAQIKLSDDSEVRIRLIDCVGFMVEGAVGHIENDTERMVKTPWYDYEIPFTQAAQIGTQKVIKDHSTVGIVITSDASFGELERNSYIPAEEQTVEELKKIGKPFIILLNSQRPYSEETRTLSKELEQKYQVSVMPVNCEQLKEDDILRIMQLLLDEFPVSCIHFNIPKWMELLPHNHWLKQSLIETAKELLSKLTYIRDASVSNLQYDNPNIEQIQIAQKDLSNGNVQIRILFDEKLYYQTLTEYTGIEINSEFQLMKTIAEFAHLKQEYDKVSPALKAVQGKGYGVVTPERNNIVLDEPSLIRHGNKFGVKMKAEASAIHMIKSSIETEIAPIVGDEHQAQDLITYIKANAEKSNDGIWEANIFGKSIEQIVDDGIQAKVAQMTEDCQQKLQEALQKIINDSNGGMICIII